VERAFLVFADEHFVMFMGGFAFVTLQVRSPNRKNHRLTVGPASLTKAYL
jgi:hypothetical protein